MYLVYGMFIVHIDRVLMDQECKKQFAVIFTKVWG